MTENEAIKHLQSYAEVVDNMIKYCKDFEPKADITGYLEKKTVFAMAISAIKEVQRYRAIGTVEECRKAAEKQKPKQAEHSKWIGINGALYDLCPTCGTNLCTDSFLGEQKENYCGNCGQKLDWSEEE